MKMMRAMVLLFVAGCAVLGAADPALIDKGQTEHKRCAGCHGLKIIATQRLSSTGWERELDKMVRWGAEIKDRQALMAYLVDTFGDNKPMPKPVLSADATK